MPQGMELRTDFPGGTGEFMITDSVRLKQIANNLISNAKRFIIKGYILLGYRAEGSGRTVIFVGDTGSGISDENLRYILKHFYKVDNFTRGTGLGLNICQAIVECLSGTITVTSELGKGTRLEVRISDKVIQV